MEATNNHLFIAIKLQPRWATSFESSAVRLSMFTRIYLSV